MNRMSKIIVISLLLVVSPFASLADHSHGYNRAIEAFNAGDYKMAIHLWHEEAVAGEMNAQEMLGAMYASGKGAKQDYAEAVKWYRMAANQGSTTSQYSLGRIYYQGQGVEKSLEQAYAWWLISAASGNTGARAKIKAVFNEMTPVQIEKAKQLTFDFLHTISIN